MRWKAALGGALAVLVASLGAVPAASAEIPTNDKIFSWIEGLTANGPRRTGSKASFEAARYVTRHFKRFGLEGVHREKAESRRWRATDEGLEVAGQPVDSFPIAHSGKGGTETGPFTTGPDGLTAEIVDVGSGSAAEFAEADVEGKIVLFDLNFLIPNATFAAASEFFYDPNVTVTPAELAQANPYITNLPDVARAAQAADAAGMVGVLSDYFDSNKYFNEEYRRVPFQIPGAWVTRAEGTRVRALLAGTEGADQATLRLEGSREPAPAYGVIGYVPGKSPETILITSHHDSVWEGAVEDASGAAEVLALAKHYAQVPADKRERTLMFATFDSHFSGYQLHQEFVKKYVDQDSRGRHMVAAVCVEHVARQGLLENGQLRVTGLPELRAIFESTGPRIDSAIQSAIVGNGLQRTTMLNGDAFRPLGGLPTDASFVFAAGVPTVSFISGPLYLYDKADTLDKVMRTDLAPVASAFAQITDEIDATPTPEITSGLGP